MIEAVAPTAWTYSPVEGHYDEVLDSRGRPRRHWRRLANTMTRLGPQQFARRWQHGRQLIQANGITFNVYGDPLGQERPWPVDPIPLILADHEWETIEAAVLQRAMLFNHLLGDIYGPQRCLSDGGLPPELIFHNPGFLRPCHGLPVPRSVFLHHYAADFGRSPDGQWWVLSDRTQTPSGLGYALENRMVSAQILPEAFRSSHVRPLTRYFHEYRQGLFELTRTKRDSPRVVLLTPGPFNEAYFEHAYLAKYLGYTLVEGADLVVRDERVYLKTLGGLSPVDIILRRQDDSYCDPLSFRGDSVLGVPGLLAAVRAGNVVVANALGTGVLETPALSGFLPGLCESRLSEKLKVPSLASWWCGEPQACRYVLNHLAELVIKPAFPRFGLHPIFAAQLSATDRDDLRRRIEANPSQFVAQEQMALSTAPVLSEQGLEARHLVLRVFAVWSGDGYVVMPGGLTRISTSQDSLVVSLQQGGGSKDTWILTQREEEPLPETARAPVDVTRTPDMPSRVADNMFWLGRYLERVESLARLARVLLPSLSSEADLGGGMSIEAAVELLIGYEYLPDEMSHAPVPEQRRWLERVLRWIVFDTERVNALSWNISQVRRSARSLKERLSSDAWRLLNRLDQEFPSGMISGEAHLLDQLNTLDRAILTLASFSGLMTENMTRSQGWRFLDMGRRLERALQLVELMRHGLAGALTDENAALDMLLQIADSGITYRMRYYTAMQADLVLDLLLVDEANPRSVGFQIQQLAVHLKRLPGQDPSGRLPEEQQHIVKALTAIRLCKTNELSADREELRDFLDSVRGDLFSASTALSSRYLSHLTSTRLLASA
ncbi:MAG: circularly permuted type 2 ATP-grasp protein [Bryobacteraceae bacterium]|nr:circularly permuted type 2 ATP-grasp protein [Bryobacteraceae bacterium]